MVLKFKSRNRFKPCGLSRRSFSARDLIILGGAVLSVFFHQISGVAAQTGAPAVDLDPSNPLITQQNSSSNAYQARTKQPLAKPSPPAGRPVFAPTGSDIQSDNLAPIADAESSGLPFGVWQGMDRVALEKLFAKIELPPRSPTLNKLWIRFLTARGSGGINGQDAQLNILRLEALYRSGHLSEILAIDADPTADPSTRHMMSFLKSKAELGLGDAKSACKRLKNAGPAGVGMPKLLAMQLLKMTIYCRAQANDIAGANLVVELAREQGIDTEYASKAVFALEQEQKTAPKLPKNFGLIDYTFASLFHIPSTRV